MEKKLKQVFDNLDAKETDELVGDIKDFNIELNAERIMSQVYEKTGLKKKKVIPWRKISMVASIAACFVLVFIGGYLAGGMGGSNISPDNNQPEPDISVADNGADDDAENTPDATYASDIDTAAPDGDNDKPASKDEKYDDGDKKTDDKKNHGNSSPLHNSDDNSQNIVVGTEDKYLDMNSTAVEELLDDSDDEIDLDAVTDEYETLDDMVADVDYIVKGTKTGSMFSKGEEANTYVLSSKINVVSVIWDNTGKDMKSTIKVNEGILYNSEISCYTHIGGYDRMRMGNDYILFLKKTGKEYYIAGTVYGKIPVSADEPLLCTGNVVPETLYKVKSVIEDAKERYVGSNLNGTSNKEDNGEKTDKNDDNKISASGTPAETVTPDIVQDTNVIPVN